MAAHSRNQNCENVFPSPGGEGQDEGEQSPTAKPK
jgi:hypothetical protein